MPIESFPDPDRHKICFRCRRWFEPEEGSMVSGRGSSMGGDMFDIFRGIRMLAEGPMKLRFKCNGCARKERIFSIAVWAFLALMLIVIAILEWLDRLPGGS